MNSSAASSVGPAHRHQAADRPGLPRRGRSRDLPEADRRRRGAVIDTSCAALLQLAGRVHSCGQKVVLTGEGADEWLVGYPWYKAAKLSRFLDVIPGLRLSDLRPARLTCGSAKCRISRMRGARRSRHAVGGPNAWIDSYGLLAHLEAAFLQRVDARGAGDRPIRGPNSDFPLERAKRWHPLNRGIWIAARVHLAGHLLQAKGDRVAMHSSVEVRYPFLDEDVFDFLAKLHPRWKLRGFNDKHLLRLLAERWVPKSVARRHKVIFRAPLDSFHMDPEPPFVDGASERGIAAQNRLFRCSRRGSLAERFSQNARRLPAAALSRNGSDGGRRNPALASSFYGRRARRFARMDSGANAGVG